MSVEDQDQQIETQEVEVNDDGHQNDNDSSIEVEAIQTEVDEGESIESNAESEEVVISIDDKPIKESENVAPWIRELRKANREKDRELKELRAKLTQIEQPRAQSLGPKPTLNDFHYDEEKFDEALSDWYERKKAFDIAEEQKRIAEEQKQKEWRSSLENYAKAKASLPVKDFDEAENAAQELLSETQQGIILHGAKNPALLVYALGKDDSRAKELASITDPVKFAFAVGRLEEKLKVTTSKKPAAAPDRAVQGTARNASAVDSTLERLRAEAAKTGDMSKVVAYKRQKRG